VGLRLAAERHFQIDPNRAAIVTEIFKKYASGENIKDIVSELKAQGIKTHSKAKSQLIIL